MVKQNLVPGPSLGHNSPMQCCTLGKEHLESGSAQKDCWSTLAEHEPPVPSWARRPRADWPVSAVMWPEDQGSDHPPALGSNPASTFQLFSGGGH